MKELCCRCLECHNPRWDMELCEVIVLLKKRFDEILRHIQDDVNMLEKRIKINFDCIQDLHAEKQDRELITIHPWIEKQIADKNKRITELEKHLKCRDERIKILENDIYELHKKQTQSVNAVMYRPDHKGIEL
jgi:predicted RNase H-like nuclease (RuvC/YqgF family)